MSKLNYLHLAFICTVVQLPAQVIPYGLSKDSIVVPGIMNSSKVQSYYQYKPLNYDSTSSPIWIVVHGDGGTGAGTINNLSTIADRRGALMVGLTMHGAGTTMQTLTSLVSTTDSNGFGQIVNCEYYFAGSVVLDKVYRRICYLESRDSINCYLSGFSSGAQFVTRYMLIRQAYPDSIPIRMALSMSPLGYTFPTDTFLGTAMPWVCGTLMLPPQFADCYHTRLFFNWNCNEHILKYYNENYAVCIGDQDIAWQGTGGCYGVTGTTRLERARNFYAFCDSNAVTRGTVLNWQYAEIPGAGHNEYTLFQTKWLSTDTSTIAERILFETPYHPVTDLSPVSYFYAYSNVDSIADTVFVNFGDTVHFVNLSQNATSYYWEFGDSTFSTSTNPDHVYATPGAYTVELTAQNSTGCDNWYVRRHFLKVLGTVGLAEKNQTSIQIWPNPAQDFFQFKSEYIIEEIVISDYKGRLLARHKVKSQNGNIDLSGLANGIYFVTFRSNEGFAVHKLVKNGQE